jgi:peptide/nickel transport system permease protein
MKAFLIRRVLQAIVVLFGVSIVVFILLHLLPGGPARAVLGIRANKVQIHGFSYKQNQTVDSLLGENIPRTLVLVGVATLLALIVAIPLGVYQAVRRNKPEDYVLTGMSFLFYSMPSFFLGIILIILLSDTLPWLPSTGPTAISPLWDQIPNLVLPVLTLTLVTVALFSRYMRSSVLENLVQDYVRTATSKGVGPRAILFRHVLRNALLPIVTLIGLSLPGILSGALIVESLFNYPGMGLLFWNAAVTDDFPTMLGTTMVVGVAVVVGSLLADVLYAALDPRVRIT